MRGKIETINGWKSFEATPICGKDLCELCRGCLACHHEPNCCDGNPTSWIIYKDNENFISNHTDFRFVEK